MRKLFIFLLFINAVNAFGLEFTPEEKAWMKEHPRVTFVGDPSWMPFEGYNRQDEYVGIVPDLLHLIQTHSPLRFDVLKTSTWEESLSAVKAKKVMMISLSEDSNEELGLDFIEYYSNPIVIIMNQKEKYLSSLYLIRDKKVAVVAADPFFKRLQITYPDVNFISVDSIEQGLQSVSSGENDAFVNTLAQTSYVISRQQLNSLRIVGRTELDTRLGFGISAEHKPLLSIVKKVLMKVKTNEAQDILSKWIRQKYIEKVDYTALYIALGVFTLIAAMGTLFYLRLKQESTRRIQAQEKMLEHQAKMAAMGEMMDSVAHQWKQPLNALSMYADLLHDDFKAGEITQEYVDEMTGGIHAQIGHMTTTLSEFRTFFRPNKSLQTVDIATCINSVLLLVKDEFLKNSITVILELHDDGRIDVIENEFKHVILNIINNAKDAFNDNAIQDRVITVTSHEEEKSLIIRICDNAGGIPVSIIDDVFKANVTSKAEGKGTGIGLYMTAQIMQKADAEIKAYNLNEGACFELRFKSKNNV